MSNMDTYAYMYKNIFIPLEPLQSLIASNNDGAGNQQFRLYIWLNNVTTYYLVVTTNNPIVTGQFTVLATGLGSVAFSPINASGKMPNLFQSTSSVKQNTDEKINVERYKGY